MTQCARILEYMREHGSITTSEAVNELGCNSLSRRITDLTSAGYNIVKTWQDGVNRWGDKTRYLEYRLEKV